MLGSIVGGRDVLSSKADIVPNLTAIQFFEKDGQQTKQKGNNHKLCNEC